MARAKTSIHIRGPAIRGADPWAASAGKMRQLLSEEERARLAVLASIVRFNKGEEIYREGQRADAVFNIITGVVKAYKTAPDGGEHITAFLFLSVRAIRRRKEYKLDQGDNSSDRVSTPGVRLTEPTFERRRLGIQCYLQAHPRTP